MSERPVEPDAEDATVPSPAVASEQLDVFGVVLPEQTGDDRDGGDWRDDARRDRDDELREDVPPHY
jgi:hypothetical protein